MILDCSSSSSISSKNTITKPASKSVDSVPKKRQVGRPKQHTIFESWADKQFPKAGAGARVTDGVGAGLAAGDDGVEIVGQSDFKRIRIHESEDVLQTDVKLGEGLFGCSIGDVLTLVYKPRNTVGMNAEEKAAVGKEYRAQVLG